MVIQVVILVFIQMLVFYFLYLLLGTVPPLNSSINLTYTDNKIIFGIVPNKCINTQKD